MPEDPNPGCREFQLVIAARNRRGLTPTQKLVLLLLSSHRQGFNPTVGQLAEEGELCVRSVQRALQALEKMKVVRSMTGTKGGRKQVSRYAIVIEGGAETATQSRGFKAAETATESRGFAETATLRPENCDTESPTEEKTDEDSKADALEGASPLPPPPAPAPEIIAEPAAKKASRWPDGQAVPDEWIGEGYAKRKNSALPEIDLDLEAVKFTNYWTAKSGKDACKRNWHATWINWTISAFAKSPSKDRSHDQQHRPASGKSSGGGGYCSEETRRRGMLDAIADGFGMDRQRTASR